MKFYSAAQLAETLDMAHFAPYVVDGKALFVFTLEEVVALGLCTYIAKAREELGRAPPHPVNIFLTYYLKWNEVTGYSPMPLPDACP